jgi:predicted Zn-dependent protease
MIASVADAIELSKRIEKEFESYDVNKQADVMLSISDTCGKCRSGSFNGLSASDLRSLEDICYGMISRLIGLTKSRRFSRKLQGWQKKILAKARNRSRRLIGE